MHMLDERRTGELSTDPALSIEGVMRVRGFDAMVRGRGVRFERREPEAVRVRRGDAAVNVVAIPAESGGPPGVIMLAAPVLAFAAMRLFAPRRRRK